VKRFPLTLAAGSAAVLLWTVSAAAAASPINDAIAALKQSSVYVAPGTENTNADTAGILLAQLNKNDNVVLVMLPASADASGEGIRSDAKQISDALGGKAIVGISVGDQTFGYSSLLPSGVAADLMGRAESLGTNTTENLTTFVRIVHDWQRENPDAPAAHQVIEHPTAKPHHDGSTPVFVGGGVLLLAALAGGIVVAIIRRRRHAYAVNGSTVSLRNTPDTVRDVLRRIIDQTTQVRNADLRDTLAQICSDTDALFRRRSSRGARANDDAVTFEQNLTGLERVVTKYIDVQDNPRFFEEPRELLRSGVDAIDGFGEYVLRSIQRDSREALTDYNVDAKILEATRYR